MSIGLKRGAVRLERHQAGWTALFEQEKIALQSLLGAYSVEIQHVGSTAIQAIDAKPILDLLLGLRSLTDEITIRPLLESMGYLHRGEQGVSGRVLYVKGPETNRTHYLHITVYNSSFWLEKIYFRDILNSQAEIAQAYNQVKQALAEQYPDDRAAYTRLAKVFLSRLFFKNAGPDSVDRFEQGIAMAAGRLIGLDHGIKRIGIAISDASRTLAREVMILTRKTRVEDFAAINALATQEEATGYVIGMPSSDAPEGVHTQADTVRLWIERFRETTSLPIIEWDEQLTSDDARDIARQHKRKYDAPIDDLAARLILQSFLDALRNDLATFP